MGIAILQDKLLSRVLDTTVLYKVKDTETKRHDLGPALKELFSQKRYHEDC